MNLFAIANLPYSQQLDAWSQQMKAMRADMDNAASAITSSLSDAVSNQTLGIGNLIAKVAAQRLQDEAKAKADTNQRLATTPWSVWDNKPLPTSIDAGNSAINLSANTLTLSDGTVIDLTSGLKKVDLTV